MTKQLSLFGEDPDEATKKAPIKVVESTTPKVYRLVPPTNIIEKSSDIEIKEDAALERKAKSTNELKTELKKERKLKIEDDKNSSEIGSKKPITDAEKLKAISLDLFAGIFPEPLTNAIAETKEPIPEFSEEKLSTVVEESVQEEMIENINISTPELTQEVAISPIQELAVEPFVEVSELQVEPLLHSNKEENTQEIELEDISADMHEPEQAIEKVQKGKQPNGQFQPEALLVNLIDDEILFSKQYYPISEVAAMFNVKVSLLRFWENEFDILKPRKNKKGDRLFRPEDVKNLKLIYFLLKEKKYTMEGAKIFIKKGKNVKEKFAAIESLKKIKAMLMELKASLSY